MSGKRSKRVRLSTGIYQDVFGIGILVRNKEHRYPLGTPLAELQRARRELLEEAGPTSRRGTLTADVDTYLGTLPEGPRRRDAKNLLSHWLEVFGRESRHALTGLRIEQQLIVWRDAARFSPGTLKHLRRELGALYRKLNGRSGENPVRDVPQVTVRYEEPRAFDYAVIRLVLEAMPDRGRAGKGQARPPVSVTKLRHTIAAYQGLTPAVIMRVRERDLDFEARTVYCRPRRKGRGSTGYTQPLTPQALQAFRRLVAAKGLGPYSTRSAAKSWTVALAAAKAQWEKTHPERRWPLPDDARPYDLRHSFAVAVMRRTKNLHAVASLLMHQSLTTTRRYLQGVVNEESRAAIAEVTADLGPAPRASKRLPRLTGKVAENRRNRQSTADRRKSA